MYVCVSFAPVIPSKRDRTLTLSCKCKMTKPVLQTGRPSYHLNSWRESALIEKSSAQKPKAFHQHGTGEKAKMI